MFHRHIILRSIYQVERTFCRRKNPFTGCPCTPASLLLLSRRRYGTVPESPEEHREKAAVGPFTWRAALVFVATGAGLYWYFTNEKAKVQEQKRKELADYKVGKARVGGPFTLVTHTGAPFTEQDILGKWSLVYFGFTNCPDICPDELDKMTDVVNTMDTEFGPIVQPIFISCDPARDSVEQMHDYISDFHPRMIGLTGTYDAVKATCKAYRVYFSTPPNTKPGDDYLVDHSIFFYLMDPNGEFVDAFGKSNSADDVRQKVRKAVQEWKSLSP
ncbi:putative SCO1-involved in stabilization of Cox1p and Cox2p [Calocera cornea HHB12733]|uniref:Putative SCO1-involved in stabilization of Cox1p and Cox2p n=1 Tax=Calocera cornea HHB12733 TaxID=1353952 RepID=A0A165JS58_9BASI|nr:putative SCO1-involved in stabilization of Cox1p and Cox2p [Calocera cornea HHB12733]